MLQNLIYTLYFIDISKVNLICITNYIDDSNLFGIFMTPTLKWNKQAVNVEIMNHRKNNNFESLKCNIRCKIVLETWMGVLA